MRCEGRRCRQDVGRVAGGGDADRGSARPYPDVRCRRRIRQINDDARSVNRDIERRPVRRPVDRAQIRLGHRGRRSATSGSGDCCAQDQAETPAHEAVVSRVGRGGRRSARRFAELTKMHGGSFRAVRARSCRSRRSTTPKSRSECRRRSHCGASPCGRGMVSTR